MAEQDLGLAVLRLTVDASLANAALTTFRNRVNQDLSGVGGGIFNGVTQEAKNAGEKAGKNLADGIKKATTGLKFESISEALDFSGALNGTLRDLREYEKALVALREVTRATAPDFGVLNDVIAATSQTIKNYASSTDQLVDAAARVALREETQRLRERLQQVRANAQEDREWSGAIRAIENAQRSAARATEEANRAYRSQLALVTGIAKKGVSDVGGAVGAIGRGVGAAARTAVNVGRAGYGVGAELGIFEEPKTGPLKQSIQQVIERFKFLGEQATTTRGIVLRTLEGVGTGAGLLEIAKNADILRQSLNAVGLGAKATEAAVSGFAKLGQSVANVLNNGGFLTDNGNTILGKLANALAPIEKSGASITSLTNELIQLGVKGGTAGLDAIEALVNGFASLPPAAQAAALAAPAVFAALSGPVSKRAQEDLKRINSLLENVGTTSLKVQQELFDVINAQAKADFGQLPKLLPPAQETLKQSAEQQTAALRTAKNIEDAINESRLRGTRFLEKQTAEIERQISLGMRQGPSNMLPGYPASPLPNANQYDRPIGPELGKQLIAEKAIGDEQERQRRLHRLAAEEARRRRIEIQKSAEAAKADTEQAARAAQNEKERAETKRRQRRDDAIGSAIIGGAFPALFGQGLGASIGGGVGGFAGGRIGGQFGFGLSLVGTALGAQFDLALQKGVTLASGLSDPIGKFQELRDAALLSSRGLEKQVEALINSGREAEAAAILQADLLKTFGSQQGLDEYRNKVDELSRSFAKAGVVITGFIAGPLSKLINKVTGPVEETQLGTQVLRATSQLAPDQRRQVQEFDRNRRRELGLGIFASQDQRVEQYKAILSYIDQITGKTAAADRNTAAALERTNNLRTISFRLVDAEVFGNKKLTEELQRRQIELERLNKLAALGSKPAAASIEQINTEAALKNYQLTQQAAKEDRQRWANGIASANRIADIEGQISIQGQRGGLSDIGIGALQALERLRTAIRSEQNAQAAVRVSPGDTSLINASKEAAANTRLAAAQTKQDLLEAYKAAQDSVRNISRSIEDMKLQLLQLQAGRGGLNQFLTGQALYDTQKIAFNRLLPQFLSARQSAAEDAAMRGNTYAADQFANLNFTGSIEGVNQAMIEFIQAQRGQERLQEDIATQTAELTKANNTLAAVNKVMSDQSLGLTQSNERLAGSIDALAAKDWSVQVNVAADGSSSAYGNVLNGALTR